MKSCHSTLALVVFYLAFEAHAFPGILVNSCDRVLEIGHEIMGVPVAASADAPDGQQNSFLLTSESSAGQSVCGGSVAQGTELTVSIDDTLVGLTTASDWSAGAGPNFIVEATNGFLELRNDPNEERGCSNSRIVNPGASINVQPLEAGEMVVRMLTAYGFGQVYAAEECIVTVTGAKVVAEDVGYLVDNASWNTDSSDPSVLTVSELLAGAESGYSIIEFNDEDQLFSLKYSIDTAQTQDVIAQLLEALPVETVNVQVSFVGFESEDGSSVELLSITPCSDASTCDGFSEGLGSEGEEETSDQVCIASGVCIESSTMDTSTNTITTTVVSDDDSWLGIGFTTPGGGMTGGGSGADIFVCSSRGLERFLVTAKSNPTSGADSIDLFDSPMNLCEVDEETGTRRMTFTRTLNGLRAIVPGTAQAIIYARGVEGEQALSSKHPTNRRGEVSIDLTSLENGFSASVKRSAPWILWCHIVCMSLAWGLFLPLAVIIANRCRTVGNLPSSSWFMWHKSFARVGWTLQMIGAICAVYYSEVYSSHLEFRHAKFGVFIIVAGFLQPISALLRPHPPPGGWEDGTKPTGRTLFEIYHKGVGWIAIISGMINVFLGARLVKDLDFESIVRVVPISIGSTGTALVVLFVVLCLLAPENPITRAVSGTPTPFTEVPPEVAHSRALKDGVA